MKREKITYCIFQFLTSTPQDTIINKIK
uniref:Uncharacterized protein n=1 Tax=Rhizophora mucronata TaxID=61149 RepID=A0A2P2QF70_RHIMU